MMRILVRFQERALAFVKAGGTVAEVRKIPCYEAVLRMKNNIANGKPAKFEELYKRMETDFERMK